MPVVLALLCAAQFMVVLDVSVVNVALPSIQHALAFDARHLAWVGNAYALSFGALLLLGARLADLYGHRRPRAWRCSPPRAWPAGWPMRPAG
ncbi:MFS transporter [Nonomuraea sp. NPDC046570]|uniref:MFS transporter n=1 Tax=Nonomuraea sp. NPDC046570 TaxID=3155255 RepID=UPI00340A5097